MIYSYSFESPLGYIALYATEEKLCGLRFLKTDENRPNAVIMQTKEQLREYFDGKRTQFDLPLLLAGSDFQKEVWNALLKIPYGTAVSYSALANLCGHPKAFRAVGTAVGKNPIPVIVPCHRVICADGTIGGFSCGLDKKEALLQIEKIDIKR